MKVLLIPNTSKCDIKNITNDVISLLINKKVEIFALNEDKSFYNNNFFKYICGNDISGEIDFVIVIGGDGTILKAVSLTMEYEIPIIGINLGTLGFLAAIEKNEINLLNSILDGDYIIDQRMTLKATIFHQNNTRTLCAVNDIVLSKNAITGILDIDVICGDVETAKYKCDGVIVSTASGSTAYAMSAGGPIMHPGVKAISITPVCSHSLYSRTIVLPENEKIILKSNADSKHKRAFVVADGINSEELYENDYVEIERYNKNINFVTLKHKNYYSSINTKLIER